MTFLNHLFLIGLAGALLPLVIHLLTRDRIQKVEFSTLRFFLRSSKKVLRRKRLQEAILLALRMLACALLAVAFARPFFRDDAVKLGTARLVVVDVSASMARPGLDEALRREARTAIDALSSGDAAGLIVFNHTATVEARLDRHLAALTDRVAALKPTHGGTNIAAALRKADAELAGVRAERKQIVLISDLQRTGWRSFKGDWRLAPDVDLQVRDLSATPRPSGPGSTTSPSDSNAAPADLAIVEADCPQSLVVDKAPRALAVRVANYGTTERKDVEVMLEVKGKKAATQKIALLRGGESVPVRFRHVFDAPGDNPGVVRVIGDDAVPDNNLWYFNTRVIPRLKVLILNGHPSPDPLQDSAFFIRTALAPGQASPVEVSARPAAGLRADDLKDALVIVLANVDDAPVPVRAALADHLNLGRGLWFLPGDQVRPEVFRRSFADLAPCLLRQVVVGGGVERADGLSLTDVDFEHPVFAVFNRPGHGDLSMPRFERIWEVTDSQRARVLARFDNGRPALLERQIGRGLSMLMVCPADLKWSNFPLRATFPAFLHQVVRHLAIRSEKRTDFRVGEHVAVSEGQRLKDPSGQALEAGAAPDRPGLYAVEAADADQAYQVAVNRDPAEADPATVVPQEVVAAMKPTGAGEARDGASRLAGAGGADRGRLWWYAMLAVGALLVGELWLGNRTTRH